jgi:hypothetical protein
MFTDTFVENRLSCSVPLGPEGLAAYVEPKTITVPS